MFRALKTTPVSPIRAEITDGRQASGPIENRRRISVRRPPASLAKNTPAIERVKVLRGKNKPHMQLGRGIRADGGAAAVRVADGP